MEPPFSALSATFPDAALAWRRDRELTAAQASFVEVAAAPSAPRASLAA